MVLYAVFGSDRDLKLYTRPLGDGMLVWSSPYSTCMSSCQWKLADQTQNLVIQRRATRILHERGISKTAKHSCIIHVLFVCLFVCYLKALPWRCARGCVAQCQMFKWVMKNAIWYQILCGPQAWQEHCGRQRLLPLLPGLHCINPRSQNLFNDYMETRGSHQGVGIVSGVLY